MLAPAVVAMLVVAAAAVFAVRGSHGVKAPAVHDPIRISGPAPATHAAVGLSDEDPAAFTNPFFILLKRRLAIHDARLIVPFDAPERATAWVAGARRAGLMPYVTLGGDDACTTPTGAVPATGNCPPPSDAAYTAAFTAMLRAFPSVTEWGAWSEPSNYLYYPCATAPRAPAPPAKSCGLVRLGAAQAASYWRDAERADRQLGRSDTIVAGETGADCTASAFNLCTTDGGRTWSGYVPTYLAALGGERPTVWGTHSYHDLQERLPLPQSETNWFMTFLNARAGAPQVWLTEEGTWLGGPNGPQLNGNADAQRAAATEFLELPLVPAAHPGQIAREYYYLLRSRPGLGFDSALLDAAGTPRPAYCVLVGAPASECRGHTLTGT
jgi:hypothetical protein